MHYCIRRKKHRRVELYASAFFFLYYYCYFAYRNNNVSPRTLCSSPVASYLVIALFADWRPCACLSPCRLLPGSRGGVAALERHERLGCVADGHDSRGRGGKLYDGLAGKLALQDAIDTVMKKIVVASI